MCSDMSEGKTKPDRQLALPADAVGEDDDAAPLALQRRLRGTAGQPPKQQRDYWSCKAAVAQICGGWDSWKNRGSCMGCALGDLPSSGFGSPETVLGTKKYLLL